MTEYKYKVETHLHTSQGSACGRSSGAEMARAYREDGYSAIVVTDHFFNGNCVIKGGRPWNEMIEIFTEGWRDAKCEGDKIGIDVFFGFEFNVRSAEFLVYNISPEWLLANPGIMFTGLEEALRMFRVAGGYVIHAHPFRNAPYIAMPGRTFPAHTDAVEVLNLGNSDYDNLLAEDYAAAHGFPRFAGADIHRADSSRRSGLAFPLPPRSVGEVVRLASEGRYILV